MYLKEMYGNLMNIYCLHLKWEAKVQRCQKEFDDISAEIKREMERFEINRVKDFKTTIVKYLQDQMAHQQQVRHKI
jgi:sorting nexin-1/2